MARKIQVSFDSSYRVGQCRQKKQGFVHFFLFFFVFEKFTLLFFFLAGPYFLGRGARARCDGQYIIHPQNLYNWWNLGLGVFLGFGCLVGLVGVLVVDRMLQLVECEMG
jgi:hypothetical protein